MANEQPNPPFEDDDQDPQGQTPPQESSQQPPRQAYPDAPVVEAADFLGLDAELSHLNQPAPPEGQPQQGAPMAPADSASSWLFQQNEMPAAPQAPAEPRLQPMPQSAAPPSSGPATRPGASWLLDPERRAAASHGRQAEDGTWLMDQDEFAAPHSDLDPNVEYPEGSYYEPEPTGRAMGRMVVRGLAAALLAVGGMGAWRAMNMDPVDEENTGPLVLERPELPQQQRGGGGELERLDGSQRSTSRTASSGAREPGELQGDRQPAARNGGRETRRPSALGTVRRRNGPVAGSVSERKFVFVPEDVAEARGVLDNLNTLSRGGQPAVAAATGTGAPDWDALREAARGVPALQGRWLGPIWSQELALAQRSLEVGVPVVFDGLDPNARRIAQAEVHPGDRMPSNASRPEEVFLAGADETPEVPDFDPYLLGALARVDGVPVETNNRPVVAFDPSMLEFPISTVMGMDRIAAAEVVGSTGKPFAPRVVQAEAGPGMGPLVGVGAETLMGPQNPFGAAGGQASVAPLGPPIVATPGQPTNPPAMGTNPLAGLGWPGAKTNLPELTPSSLRYAQPADLWLRTTIPTDKFDLEVRLRTPRVGLVRVVSAGGEVFQGRLYAVGEGQVWLDTSLGRMSLDHGKLQRIERIEGKGTGDLNGLPRTQGLDRVRVKVAGGYFVGYQLSREGNTVVLLTDDGHKLKLRSDQVEADGPRRVAILRREDGSSSN